MIYYITGEMSKIESLKNNQSTKEQEEKIIVRIPSFDNGCALVLHSHKTQLIKIQTEE